MILISHRGNLNGPNNKKENQPNYLQEALNLNFDIEIDVWFYKNSFYLGHDEPIYKIEKNYLNNKKIWCHAKNLEALVQLSSINAHYFWHENDKFTLTSKNIIWTYPGNALTKNSICVLPEKVGFNPIGQNLLGVCSDFILKYKNNYD